MRKLFGIAAMLLLAACDAASPTLSTPASSTGSTPPPSSSKPAATKDQTPPVPEIWRFEARKVGGGTIDGRDLVGKKVAVWLWAPWCPPCNRLAPEVAEAAADYPDITFLGVPGQDSDDAHESFVEKHGLQDVMHAIDERRALWGHFGSATQEAWVFVDDDGEATARTRYGEMEPELLRSFLDDLRAA